MWRIFIEFDSACSLLRTMVMEYYNDDISIEFRNPTE
jgi:hypothetical protein